MSDNYIDVSDEALRALESTTLFGELNLAGCERLPNSLWRISIPDNDVVERLAEMRFPAESYSDLVMRLVNNYKSGGKQN